MKTIKGTRTEKNLLTAFAGESQARNRYTFFAAKAKSDGYMEIQQVFEEIANQEKEHAKRLFKFMEGGEVEITAGYPAGIIDDTMANLVASASGENHEYTEMYPSFAKVAEEEGFPEIAAVMRCIAVAEDWHEKRFLAFAEALKNDRVFTSSENKTWRCLNCGYLHTGTQAPSKCPACDHPVDYFEVLKTPK